MKNMSKERNIDIKTLVNSYLDLTKEINVSAKELINDIASYDENAKLKHSHYLSKFNVLERDYVGDIEHFYHSDVALLAIKQSNIEAVGRARKVCLNSLQRYEQLLVCIEDRSRFARTIKLAKLSILVAVVSVIIPAVYSFFA